MKDVIFLTGGAQRVGLYCAQKLQQQGYQLIISYRTRHKVVDALEEAGVICLQADLTDIKSVQQLVQAIQAVTPTLRAIIHNASDWKKDQPLQTDDNLAAQLIEDSLVFDAMMAIHAKTPYLLNRALLPLLQAQVAASAADAMADIIHISDFVASVGSEKHQAYAASKAALENLTFSQARLLAPTIKVNAIAPALLMFNQGDDEAYKQKALAKSLLGIEPGPAEVLASIQYLLQSRYITGRVLALDGGRQLKLP
jgi:dihydromonapterin reductase / dihydrofolate reductase